ncbi:MAG: cysteine--tRNA ligase [Ignavibacteria bacterium]|nr:cysteine--tRNA ligase [Ignavibacteria bacterium]
MDIKLFNTLGRQKQVFEPIEAGKAGLYTCGPTVYDFQHIGNFRTFMFEDLLKRVLIYNGYEVTHIMNITDVGHLVSDGDEGEDKMEKGSARTGKTVWEIAEYYTQFFLDDAKALNLLPPTKYTKATDYIQEQIDMVKCLDDKGYTYVTSDGVYFDTSKLKDYGKLANLDIEGLEEGSRIQFSAEKKNKTDFALWKFSPKDTDTKRQMEWDSPWGKGFPGWHIECSAMSRKYLGDTFDIHCGGIDHIPVHHTNEIAQSEACTGKPFAHYWMHGAFLEEESGKMSKSKGEFLRVETLIKHGYTPMDYRYLCLGTHYRKRLLFSWEILEQAKTAMTRLKQNVQQIRDEASKNFDERDASLPEGEREKFLEAVNDDLNMPQALAVLWGVVRNDKLTAIEKMKLVNDFNRVLGLDLDKDIEAGSTNVPAEIMELVEERIAAKKAKDFKKADALRDELKSLGWEVLDKKDGVEVKEIGK